MMGWDWRLRTAESTGLLFIPVWFAIWTMVWWHWLWLTPNSPTRTLWQPEVLLAILSAETSLERLGERAKEVPWDFRRSFTCRKILHGTSGFTSHPKEGVLRIFIALKNPSPWSGSNPLPLGPVASTLTTTPPKWLICYYDNESPKYRSTANFCSICVKHALGIVGVTQNKCDAAN
jgi:hypothetical protein